MRKIIFTFLASMFFLTSKAQFDPLPLDESSLRTKIWAINVPYSDWEGHKSDEFCVFFSEKLSEFKLKRYCRNRKTPGGITVCCAKRTEVVTTTINFFPPITASIYSNDGRDAMLEFYKQIHNKLNSQDEDYAEMLNVDLNYTGEGLSGDPNVYCTSVTITYVKIVEWDCNWYGY